MAILLKVRGINSANHDSNEFISISLYFLDRNKSKQLVYIQIEWELHLVDRFRAIMLIQNNIIGSKWISIDIAKKTALVASYKVCIPISARQRLQLLIKKVLNVETITILPHIKTFVPVLLPSLLDNQDFFFKYWSSQTLLYSYT